MNRTHIILVILLSTLLSSCHPLFCSWDFGYKQLDELLETDRVYGKYYLTDESIQSLKSKGYSQMPKLWLLKSGDYELTDAPNLMFNLFGENDGLTSYKSGKWSASCGKSYNCMLELNNLMVVPIARKDNGPMSILITIGDGDNCEGVIFERHE